MYKINLYCVGNLKDKEYLSMCDEYKKRISRFASINIIENKKKNELNNINLIIENETKEILNKINASSVVLFDVKGDSLSSEKFAEFIEKYFQTNSELNFVIGGSYGVSNFLKQNANKKISLSAMTFPHRLFRVMVLEQIYRAFTIINNVSYHK